MVNAAAHAPKALEYLLHRFGSRVPITEKVLEAAAGAGETNALRLILHRANHLAITKRMMEAMFHHSQGFGRGPWGTEADEKLEFLWARGKPIPITEDILIAAAGHEVADVLARQYPNEVKLCLTDHVLLATAASKHSCMKTLKLYERRFGCRITDTLRLVYRLGAAVRDKHLWAVRRLLEQGAPPDTADSNLRTPLHHAAGGHRQSIVEALLQTRSVDLNAADFRGETPLFVAVRTGDSTIARILLAAGADPNVVNFRGQTPWSIAEERVYLRIMGTLEEFGADTSLASCEFGIDLHDDR
ncbi:ankyrin repeat-containing domain protein [Aspergillus carlsbadensis]|nr:ankyrin repeat-containing domain protein [Aspergillus carlsbadensis]